jgi:hypothetical protein
MILEGFWQGKKGDIVIRSNNCLTHTSDSIELGTTSCVYPVLHLLPVSFAHKHQTPFSGYRYNSLRTSYPALMTRLFSTQASDSK